MAFDLPAGGKRLLQRAEGYLHTFVVGDRGLRRAASTRARCPGGSSGARSPGRERRLRIPIISADSHITEPPNTYVDYIDPAYRDRAPQHGRRRRGRRRPVRHRRHEAPGGDGPRGGGGQAGRGDPRQRRAVRRPAPRRLGPRGPAGRPGPRRRGRRGHLPDRRHGALQPPRRRLQEGVLRRLQPLDRRVLRARILDRLLGCGQTAMRSPEEGIADLAVDQGARPAGRDDAGRSGRRADYDYPAFDEFWEAAIELGLPLSFHILTTRGERTRGPKHERVPVGRAGLPGHHGDARARRRVRAPPRAAGRVRRGRRRLGAALHVPDGPRLQAPPLLAAAGPGAVAAAVASTSPRTST